MADLHRIEIVSKFFADSYTAECSCGWRSEEMATSDAAVQRSREHRAIASDAEFRERAEAVLAEIAVDVKLADDLTVEQQRDALWQVVRRHSAIAREATS